MRLLIDGDVLLYSCGFACEKMKHKVFQEGDEAFGPVRIFNYKKEAVAWIDGEEGYYIESEREVEPLGNAIQALKTKLNSILYALKSNEYVIYLTGKGNYRDEVATILPYKGNRDPNHKPVHYKAMREYLLARWNTELVEGYEADDSLSMAQYQDKFLCEEHGFAYEEQAETCIVTIDKDLLMVPGWHYNPNKREEKYWVTEEEAIKFFYTQLLTGDMTDNIQGIPNIGPKKAEKILAGVEGEFNLYYEVCMAYKNADLPHTAVVENARLLWMSRKEPDDWRAPE